MASYQSRSKVTQSQDIWHISSVIRFHERKGSQYKYYKWHSQHQEQNICQYSGIKLYQQGYVQQREYVGNLEPTIEDIEEENNPNI